MNYKLIKDENNTKTVKIEFDAKEWSDINEDAFNKEKGKYTVQGFRKGKAPRKAIENAYGANIFLDAALDIAYGKAYSTIMTENKDINPIDYPQLTIDKMDDTGLVINFVIPCLPPITLGDYTGLTIKGEKFVLPENAVEQELNKKQLDTARIVEAQEGATIENGSIATFDFVGSVDGEKFEGGSAQSYELEIGSNQFIPGFEEQMIGMKVGETKDLKVKFPENYHAENLKGKDAIFNVLIHKISKKELPELNDEWAANSSEFETLAELKSDIEKKLVESGNKRAELDIENKIIETIVKATKIEIPDVLVEKEIDRIMQDFEQKLKYQGMDLESYVKYYDSTIEEFRSSRKEQATQNIKTRMTLEEILKKENITATKEEVEQKIDDLAKKYGKNVDEIKKALPQEQYNYLASDIIMDKLIKLLKDKNTITF